MKPITEKLVNDWKLACTVVGELEDQIVNRIDTKLLDSEPSTTYEHKHVWVHNICACGCSKISVPYHLRNEPLAVRFYPSQGYRTQEYVRFRLSFDPPPETQHGDWELI